MAGSSARAGPGRSPGSCANASSSWSASNPPSPACGLARSARAPAMSSDAPTPDVQRTTDLPLFAGRYQLFDKLGEGGLGAVFRARDAQLDRAVALKLLPEGSTPDADALARFRREAKALARLSHPGIIHAYDSGEVGGRPFLVMELVDGRTLSALLREQGPVSPGRAADL